MSGVAEWYTVDGVCNPHFAAAGVSRNYSQKLSMRHWNQKIFKNLIDPLLSVYIQISIHLLAAHNRGNRSLSI